MPPTPYVNPAILTVCAFVLSIAGDPSPAQAGTSGWDDPPYYVHRENPDMNAAMAKAQRTYRDFLKVFFSPTASQHDFLVKVPFKHGNRTEYLWISDLNLATNPASGTILDKPITPGLTYLQHVTFDQSDVVDWRYIVNGCIRGDFTSRVILKEMTPEERAAATKDMYGRFCD